MALTNLLAKFTNKETPAEHFFALNLNDEMVRAAVWTVKTGQTRIVNLGKGEAWDGKTKESLLKAVDQSLSVASEGVAPEPSGVIFGLPDVWVDKETINAEKKVYLKFLCDELELKPLGFVVTDTAIIADLKIEEGAPLSAILIQLSTGEINLTLVKLGKIIGSQLVGRSGDLGADTEEGLSRFDKIDTLPARIILYNGSSDFEEDKQQLLSFDWEDKLPFIHFPKVESLSSETTVKAVALAGGSEVAKSLGLEIKEPETKTPAEASAESLGFVRNEDIATKEKPKEESVAAAAMVVEPAPPKPKTEVKPIFEKLKQLWRRLPRLPKSRWLLFLGIGFFGLLILLGWLYWYLPKAKVALYLEPQIVNQELALTLDTETTTVAAGETILPARQVEKSVSGTKTVAVTGSKTIGDPAQGGVTLYNKTTAVKTFTSGTVLLGADQLVFTLDEDTTVASRSAEENSDGVITITPGKADANITAANIGPESNLGTDSRLTFKQFSEDDYYAKTSGLSGGTAREVKAVTQDDLDNLETDLISELVDKARDELKSSLGDDQMLIEQPEELVLTDKNFSQAEGEAADNLSLTGQLDYQGIVYRQAELDLLLKEAIKTKIPENFVISELTDLELGAVTDMILPITYEAKLLPKLDLNEIKKNLAGRFPDKVEPYLVSLPQFVKADIQITPDLPRALKTLPRQTKNINLEIKPAQ
ncbi:MAG: hypothetical protein U1C50_02370 [Patescibacteria group bacterium]|nr:hypothetical protein [Candidatus Beckwithbacteria bacterium]MDZ4229076.1 hypothetical protein [Patescibacteria group bacterium]